MKLTKTELRALIKEALGEMEVPEGGRDVIRAKHTQALAEAISPIYESTKEALRDAMIPVLQEAAEELGGPGEADFHDEARSLVYDAIKVHLQDIVDSVLGAPYQKNN